MLSPSDVPPFEVWLEALRRRHLARASTSEIEKGIRLLSTLYVERRARMESGSSALDGEAKRAAFALFYTPVHFLLVQRIVQALGAASPPPKAILDLGCGLGVAGAAWALEAGGVPQVDGVDQNPWAVEEARWTLKTLGLQGRARRGDLLSGRFPGNDGAVVAAFTVNELDAPTRSRLLRTLLSTHERGARILVVEPIAKPVTPFWDEWSAAFLAQGGRADEWRFPADLPPEIESLDRGAGLEHRELTARTVSLGLGA